MKKIIVLTTVILISFMFIAGCSSNRWDFRGGQYRLQNLTDEKRQRMFEERQQKAIESCQEKNEGDSCILESPRGEIEGSCKIQDEDLMCLTERPMRQR